MTATKQPYIEQSTAKDIDAEINFHELGTIDNYRYFIFIHPSKINCDGIIISKYHITEKFDANKYISRMVMRLKGIPEKMPTDIAYDNLWLQDKFTKKGVGWAYNKAEIRNSAGLLKNLVKEEGENLESVIIDTSKALEDITYII